MGEYTIVPRQSLYKVDKSVPSHIAALAEPLACVVNATGKLKPQPGEFAVILGAGPIGLLFSSLLLAGGVSKLVVSEPSEYRRNAAKAIGADIVVHPDDLMSTLEREMPQGADITVEAVGSLLPQAIRIARSGGRVMQFGHDETANPQIPLGEMLKKELVIYGAFIGRFSFEKTARIMESGEAPPGQDRFPHDAPVPGS
jgi:(R,R)-butanediol dehydrogenase/meso-butanediol dehydrogenase/diacetyl reductase